MSSGDKHWDVEMAEYNRREGEAMDADPLVRLRRLLGEQWSPQWRAIDAVERACDEIERLRSVTAKG